MGFNLVGRSFVTLLDFTPNEIRYLLDLAQTLKRNKRAGVTGKRLAGKNIALIFEKPSTRTRCAFTVACWDEGAHAEYLGKGDIQLGKKETVKDTARVLGRMFDGIQFRGFEHWKVEQLAAHAGVPVWNGLTDDFHPTQTLATLQTLLEEFGRLQGLCIAYVGDGRNNVANSLMIGAAKMGLDFRIVAPQQLFPRPELLERARTIAAETRGSIQVTDSVAEGVRGAQMIYTEVWASMGEEELIPQRIALLSPYRVDRTMLERTGNPDVIFSHCLPAFHNLETELAERYPEICEVTEEVFEGPANRAFEEAENRVHTIKAVMVATLAGA